MCPTTENAKTKKVLFTPAYHPQLLQCHIVKIPKPPMLESLSSASASEEGGDADFDEASTSKELH